MSNSFLETSHRLIRSTFEWLQKEKNTVILEYLLSMEGPTFDSLREQAFQNAIQEGAVPIVNSLLDAGMDPNEEMCYDSESGERITPICCASFYGHLEVVKILVSAGADPNKTIDGSKAQDTALQQALKGFNTRRTSIWWNDHYYQLIRVLLNAKVDVNSAKGSSLPALFLAIRPPTCNSLVVDLLLLEGATVHSRCPENCTPLFSCIEPPKYSLAIPKEDEVIHICGSLIKAGDDVNAICSDSGRSVLHKTILTNSIKLLRLILGAGAKVESSAIGLACSMSDMRLVMLLADARVNGASPVSATAAYIYSTGHLASTCELIAPAYKLKHLDTCLRSVQKAVSLLPMTVREEYINLISQAASRFGQDEIVATMRAAGAAGPSDLMEAVRQKDFGQVQMFLRAGADVNGRCCITGTTVLHEAIKRGSDKTVIQALVNAGVDINATSPKDDVNYTPVMLAIETGNNQLVEILVDAGADLNISSGNYTALRLAVDKVGASGFIRYLLLKGADAGDSFAIASAVKPDLTTFNIILDARSPISAQRKKLDDFVLQKAIGLPSYLAVWRLLKHVSTANDPDPRAVSLKPIQHFKCTSATNAFGVAILRHKYDPALPIVQRFLEAGADPNSIVNTEYRESAFTMAIATKNIDLINLLIDTGAIVNAPAGDGIRFTPLQAAADVGSLELVRKLRELGADVNAPPAERSGATVLQLAAMGGYIGIARYLLDEGADVNAPPAKINGRTALEVAAEHGRIDMIQFLLNAGAKIHGPGGEQYSRALNFASRNGKRAARRYLESIHAQHLDHSPETFVPDDLNSGHVAN